MDYAQIVVCSFYTADDYYRSHAESLEKNLTDLGVRYELREIEKEPGEDWADICRRKIAFLAGVCRDHPDSAVFWIDVDCRLLGLPDYVADFSADLIGFQRGFGSALGIGYGTRTRFWEPCFFGINATAAGRRFIEDAAALEANADLKATDDYFFEESWRSNAAAMSFQIIPSAAVLGRSAPGVSTFFSFGSSGNVAEFKDTVEQHRSIGAKAPRLTQVKRRALRGAKRAERLLTRISRPWAGRARRWADALGVTHVLTADTTVGQPSRHRAQLAQRMLTVGQSGDLEEVRALAGRLTAQAIPTAQEIGAIGAAESFAHFARHTDGDTPLTLTWWPRPFPGNFGDWLGPLILRELTQRPLQYHAPTAVTLRPNLVTVGSIGRFIRSQSIVVGTGVASLDLDLDPRADYVSVRGPLTAQLLRDGGGPIVESFGDPGVLLSRIVPVERTETNGRIALVRHFTHAGLPVTLRDDMDELSVLMSHPDQITRFLTQLNTYDAVVTSAMHVMIACHSYGIPCTLVAFTGFESAVHGTGVKYADYSRGAGLEQVWEPHVVDLDLRKTPWEDLMRVERIADGVLNDVEHALAHGVDLFLDKSG